jgi:hypothetical protein
MMEKPKKERRFLKTLGKIGEILIQEVLLKVGSNLIKRIGGKKTLPSILILFLSISLFAQYPNTGNKQRLGFQTTADGLVWRGSISDTASIQPVSNQNAWVILDTVNLKIYSFDFSSNVWNQVGTGGGSAFTQPVDSLFFNVNVPTDNVDTAKMRWDSDLATVVLGLNDNVPNEIGFKNFWLVKNQTGATITKGSIVYANGTVGASGRITVAKFIANGTIDAKYLLGITAHDLSNGEDGYVISFGKIRKVKTDTFAAGAILYPSPTTAGVWTDVEPIAPNINMPIGFCINSHANNGTIAIRVASGYKLNELHDVAITSPVDRASLYYRGGLWRDTTAALLVSDTASMLTNYLRSGVASNTYLPLAGGTMTGTINRQEGSNDGSTSTFYYNILNYFAKRDNNKGNQTAQITFTDRPGTATSTPNVRTSDIYLMTAKNLSGGQLGQYLDTTLSIVANQDGGRIGISNLNPAYKLDVNGTFNATGNSLIGGTLGITGATTLTGALNGTSAIFSGNVAIGFPFAYKPLEVFSNFNDFVSVGTNQMSQYQWTGIHFGYRQPNTDYRASAIVFQRNEIPPYIDATGKIHLLNVSYANGGRSADLRDAKLTISNIGGYVGINDTNPTYQLDVNGTLGVTGATTLTGGINGNTTFNNGNIAIKTTTSTNWTSAYSILELGNSNTYNTIWGSSNGDGGSNSHGQNGIGNNIDFNKYYGNGAAGYIVMSGGRMSYWTAPNGSAGATRTDTKRLEIDANTLTTFNATVFNEGSGDFDTRIESDGNANMVFVDASTDRVGIGYASPTKTLDVNGEVRINTLSATPTSLLGKDGSNVVGEVTTLAQTGLMTRNIVTNASTISGSELINVTHDFITEPTAVLLTVFGSTSYILQVASKNSSTFTVQVKNYDGTPAINATLISFSWLAIK